ncbi:MAG: hypothetical protein ACQGVK_16210 [Myxococcota bacterium]
MQDRPFDLESLFPTRREVSDLDALRAWCDALPVGETVVATLGIEAPPHDTPSVAVQFAAGSHLRAEACEARSELEGAPGEAFASDQDPLSVSQRLSYRLEKLEPGGSVDVWVGTAAELSPHVFALVFNAAAFLARTRLTGWDHSFQIVVSEPGMAGLLGEAAAGG